MGTGKIGISPSLPFPSSTSMHFVSVLSNGNGRFVLFYLIWWGNTKMCPNTPKFCTFYSPKQLYEATGNVKVLHGLETLVCDSRSYRPVSMPTYPLKQAENAHLPDCRWIIVLGMHHWRYCAVIILHNHYGLIACRWFRILLVRKHALINYISSEVVIINEPQPKQHWISERTILGIFKLIPVASTQPDVYAIHSMFKICLRDLSPSIRLARFWMTSISVPFICIGRIFPGQDHFIPCFIFRCLTIFVISIHPASITQAT